MTHGRNNFGPYGMMDTHHYRTRLKNESWKRHHASFSDSSANGINFYTTLNFNRMLYESHFLYHCILVTLFPWT